ncbi:PREDICTED: high affinity immunoglobulin epsilon receptor subunit alpha isoform X1 [Bison bison bison]|uniref:FCER1A protein n=4 Tax=Bos TaxID=9903 RepID=A6QQQ4_BOVIN|nr:high affinity immunoglobulin epsilon receptor subunit alpha precursor [Bos taurus]XP_005911131.1 PREDICTED: high affinity immunoglobulin epsilon receptor subunit alpha [Bos mutus]XP_010845151.1 PREDICTED: high affinity immunoglobulin epsilon receptor subunit alpha isoform X1 [Bison bison bison]XP_027394091.1 high affinity immunoglobulin epsilon receptor subunit alpha isoform X1 [Bos indicus x Bos taurus]AAI49947.1 FCER1A protein [Bos taurus]ELR44969.1 High affinity immunoglobulin epsilon re
MPTIPMGAPALLWIALLLFSPDGMSAAIWKSKVSLNPPWRKILKGDAVTLTCGTNGSSEDQSSLWIHNGTSFTTNNSRWHIVKARMQDSGEYQCRIKGFAISEPVYLNVISDWLIIQASAEVMMEGESLFLRCHSWKNLNVFKVIYYKDNKALKYWYENHNISITNVTEGNSGIYYCVGRIQRLPYISNKLKIIVKKPYPQSNYFWLQFLIPLLVVILFAVDTGLLISTQQQFTLLLKMKRTRKRNRFTDPQPKPDPPGN